MVCVPWSSRSRARASVSANSAPAGPEPRSTTSVRACLSRKATIRSTPQGRTGWAIPRVAGVTSTPQAVVRESTAYGAATACCQRDAPAGPPGAPAPPFPPSRRARASAPRPASSATAASEAWRRTRAGFMALCLLEHCAERLADEVVELAWQRAVRGGEAPQVQEEVLGLLEPLRVVLEPLSHQALDLPEVPLLSLTGSPGQADDGSPLGFEVGGSCYGLRRGRHRPKRRLSGLRRGRRSRLGRRGGHQRAGRRRRCGFDGGLRLGLPGRLETPGRFELDASLYLRGGLGFDRSLTLFEYLAQAVFFPPGHPFNGPGEEKRHGHHDPNEEAAQLRQPEGERDRDEKGREREEAEEKRTAHAQARTRLAG